MDNVITHPVHCILQHSHIAMRLSLENYLVLIPFSSATFFTSLHRVFFIIEQIGQDER